MMNLKKASYWLCSNNFILKVIIICLFVHNCQRQKEKVEQKDTSATIKVEEVTTKAEEPITKVNWESHPKIKAIQKIIEEVEAGITFRYLKTSERSYDCETHSEVRTIVKDTLGIVRKYKREGGSDDSAASQVYYYDKTGELRFVLNEGGAFNGSTIEQRIYYDYNDNLELFTRIWEVTYESGIGAGYRDLIDDPIEAFEAELPSCSEGVE
jgi:hypothetical protein